MDCGEKSPSEYNGFYSKNPQENFQEKLVLKSSKHPKTNEKFNSKIPLKSQ
jgi:hypothetical protein